MAAKFSDNAKAIYEVVTKGNDVTAADIAEETGLTTKQVNATVTFTFCKQGLMERVPAFTEVDGNKKEVKLIKLTDAGKSVDINAEKEEA